MSKSIHLASAADAAHSLALELYRYTSRWPECEREGLSLEVRRAGRELSSCLNEANERLRGRALRRAVDNARGKHARLAYLIRFATDMGYRKLSVSSKVDEMLSHLEIDLDVLTWEAYDDPDLLPIDGVVDDSAPRQANGITAGNIMGKNHHTGRQRRGR